MSQFVVGGCGGAVVDEDGCGENDEVHGNGNDEEEDDDVD